MSHSDWPPISYNILPRPIIIVRPFGEMSNGNRMFSDMNSLVNIDLRNEGISRNLRSVHEVGEDDNNNDSLFNHYPSQNYLRPTLQTPIIGQAMRIQVYINNVRAEPLPDITGHFRYCTSVFYRDNPTQIYRLREFILRDVVAIRESVRVEGQPMPFPGMTDNIATIMIMRSLATYEIRHLHLVNVLRPFLDVRAVHFCHELYNFANSQYDISDYDRNVRYPYQPHDSEFSARFYQELSPTIRTFGETIVLDSDNEEAERPDQIEVSSSTDDSDVEILSHSFRSIGPHNSAPIDQPSTSTGIRDSLNHTYNIFQYVNGGLFQVSFSSQIRRVRPILHSSSDDEESTIAT